MKRLRFAAHAIACAAAISLAGMGQLPAAAPAGAFAGKFELVMLFNAGHRPVIRDGRQYMANRNLITFRRPNGELVQVPAGMVTDLASIPRLVSNLLPPGGLWSEAALPHDLCYKSKGSMVWFKQTWRSRAQPYTRAECDKILREGMVALGVPTLQRVTIYEGVRIGGAAGWGR
jgi:hypothetical protein